MRFLIRAALGFFLFILTAGLTVVALGFIGRSMQFERPSFGGRNFERTWTVTTLTLEKSSVTPQIEGFGTIVAGDAITVRSNTNGSLMRKAEGLRNGSFVSAGDLLFELDPFTFATAVTEAEIALAEAQNTRRRLNIDVKNAEAQIPSAASSVDLAADNLRRQTSLRDQDVVSDSAVDTAKNNLSAAEATLEARQLALETAQTQLNAQDLIIQRAELALLRNQKALDDTRVTAPISGLISSLNFASGSPVGTNEALATITDPTSYQVKFQLSDAEYARFLDDPRGIEGRPVIVSWTVGDAELTYRATVEQVSATVEQSNGGIEVLANLQRLSADTPLRQGAFVNIRMREQRLVDVFQLPDEAVSEEGNVFIIENNRLTEVDGTILRRLGDALVVDLPLESGTEIIEKRYGQLAPGVRVEIFDETAESNQETATQSGANGNSAVTTDSDEAQKFYRVTPDQAAQAKAMLANAPIPENIKTPMIEALDKNLMPETMANRMASRLGIDLANAELVTEPSTTNNAEPASAGSARSESQTTANSDGPTMVDLTPEQAAKAKELLAGFPIPEERKAPIMAALENNQIPERLANRIGSQIGL